jgi:putative transposase
MERERTLTDEQWSRIENLLPGRVGSEGCTAKDNRLFIDGVLWINRTGAPWRDLPLLFGNWNTVYTRFNRWGKKNRWEALFQILQDEPDFEWVSIDSTIVRAHQHSAGGKGGLKIRPLAVPKGATQPKSMLL